MTGSLDSLKLYNILQTLLISTNELLDICIIIPHYEIKLWAEDPQAYIPCTGWFFCLFVLKKIFKDLFQQSLNPMWDSNSQPQDRESTHSVD